MGTKNIKNIIFDLGGVLLNIDYDLTIKAFTALGIPDFKAQYSQAAQNNLFDRLDKGHVNTQGFIDEIQAITGNHITKNDILNAWNAMLLEMPKERVELLEELKKDYRLFLLSNTNEIHIPVYNDILQASHGFRDLAHIFEKQYYSFEIGMRKPDVEIYEFVLKENSLKAEETLFIDDSKQHLEGAAKAGLHTHWLQPEETILDVFPGVLNS